MEKYVDLVLKNRVVYLGNEVEIEKLVWNPHPKFEGVFLKHLVKGETTDNHYSSHLVKIQQGYEIGNHVHEDNLELHEAIDGLGKGIFANKEIAYKPGLSVVIPKNIKHKVVADKEDLYLFAKFFPALV